MSGAGTDNNTDAGSASPKERADSARQEAFGAFEAAEDLDRATKRAPAESEAAGTFAAELANAVVQGFSEANAKSYCSQVADASKFYNKTELKELLEDEIENKRIEDDERPPLDELIERALKEVVIVRTTDAKQSTIYRWDFTDCQFETTADGEGRAHFAWPAFRNEYFDAAGRDPSKPTKNRRGGEEWRDFIVEMVRERGSNATTRGPRTVAVDALQNFIRRTTAYATVKDMIERDGVYIDDDPEAEDSDPDEIYVPNHDIKRICDDNELASVRELQIELDARGMSSGRISGVSESTFVNNNKVTYWVLNAEIAEPGAYEPEPVDPADQVREEEAEAEDDGDDSDNDDDDGTGETAEDGGSGDDSPPGALGAVGTNPDDEGGDDGE